MGPHRQGDKHPNLPEHRPKRSDRPAQGHQHHVNILPNIFTIEDATKDPARAEVQREEPTTESGTTTAPNRTRDTEAGDTWTRLSRSNLEPPKSIMSHKISSIKTINKEKSHNTGKHMPDLSHIGHKIYHIGALILDAEAEPDQSLQRDYTTEINKVISETKTNLSEMEARFCNNIKLDASWIFLTYATFLTKLISTTPYKDKLETRKYELSDIENRIHDRITITRKLLSDMASPVVSTVQEHIYRECLQRVEELIVQAYKDLQDVETKYERHTTNSLEYFGLTLGIIKHRARTTYNDLCAWETPAENQDKSKETSNKEKEANQLQVSPIKTLKTRDTALTFAREPPDPQDPSMERDTDSERATTNEANLRGELHNIE